MKILYLAPEHVSGTLSLFKREHERRGDTCRFITFWHSRWDFPDDICLNLHGMPKHGWVRGLRKLVAHDPHAIPSRVVEDRLPHWAPNPVARALHALRDERNWRKINAAICQHQLFAFDVLHLDGGADFTRDARFARTFKSLGKPIIAYYHGSDLRSRGYIPAVDRITDLRLTPEWDLAAIDQRLCYQYLPLDLSRFMAKPYAPGTVLRIGHAARNPQKGTAHVQRAVAELSRTHRVELVLIQNMTYDQALAAKESCDLFVDQLTNEGGWGYGMSGVEALAMGIPVVTNVPVAMSPLIGDHPFVQADPASISDVLRALVDNPARCADLAARGRAWVDERHEVRRVVETLYAHYQKLGLAAA